MGLRHIFRSTLGSLQVSRSNTKSSQKKAGKSHGLSQQNGKPGLATRLVATTLLTRVVDDGRNLDALCDSNNGIAAYLALSPKDRALARAIAVTTLRRRNHIEVALNRLMNRPPPKNARFLIHAMHAAAAQILYMEVPSSAAVNLAVDSIRNDKRTNRFTALANAVLRRMTLEADELREKTADTSPFPAWFAKRLRTGYGKEKAGQIARAVMQQASLDVSVKSNPEAWANKLDGTVLPTGSVRIGSSSRVSELPGFDEGEWWVQDAAAAIPARLIKAPAGASVLELCAAPGGKTAQLVTAGFNVTALDISAVRLSRLRENLERLKLQADLVEADILEWEPEHGFDAVLLDAPCSSTGTIRRHPDVIWARRDEEIGELAELQFSLLQKAVGFVKPGGCLVFSNCSILKEEGENLLNRVIGTIPDLKLDKLAPGEIPGLAPLINGQGAMRSLPSENDGCEIYSGGLDGFFACRFVVGYAM